MLHPKLIGQHISISARRKSYLVPVMFTKKRQSLWRDLFNKLAEGLGEVIFNLTFFHTRLLSFSFMEARTRSLFLYSVLNSSSGEMRCSLSSLSSTAAVGSLTAKLHSLAASLLSATVELALPPPVSCRRSIFRLYSVPAVLASFDAGGRFRVGRSATESAAVLCSCRRSVDDGQKVLTMVARTAMARRCQARCSRGRVEVLDRGALVEDADGDGRKYNSSLQLPVHV